MPDTDTLTLKEAGNTVVEIDVQYRNLRNIDDKEDMKPKRDEAFAAYTSARLKLLAEGVITNQDDANEMKALRREVEQAAQVQAMIVAAGRVAVFLTRLALL